MTKRHDKAGEKKKKCKKTHSRDGSLGVSKTNRALDTVSGYHVKNGKAKGPGKKEKRFGDTHLGRTESL